MLAKLENLFFLLKSLRPEKRFVNLVIAEEKLL